MAEPFTFPVDRSALMLFARSLGHIRPGFSEPDHSAPRAVGGIIAPPTAVGVQTECAVDRYPALVARCMARGGDAGADQRYSDCRRR